MPKLRNATLLFLTQRSGGQIARICLAMKKRGFGKNRWNGVGGKVKAGETVEQAAAREAQEEIGVLVKDIKKTAELSFYFPDNPSWDQLVHVYLSEKWEGQPVETDEMKPRWFAVADLPFNKMWPDDIFWLPKVIKGSLVKANFEFGKGDVILGKEIEIIRNLS